MYAAVFRGKGSHHRCHAAHHRGIVVRLTAPRALEVLGNLFAACALNCMPELKRATKQYPHRFTYRAMVLVLLAVAAGVLPRLAR